MQIIRQLSLSIAIVGMLATIQTIDAQAANLTGSRQNNLILVDMALSIFTVDSIKVRISRFG